jgi:hypothetical protein
VGREYDPQKLVGAAQFLSSPKFDQRAKVQRLRELGLPETVVLDYLANIVDKQRGSRNGPRDRYHVWVRAAEWLMSIEPVEPPPAARPPRSAERGGILSPAQMLPIRAGKSAQRAN